MGVKIWRECGEERREGERETKTMKDKNIKQALDLQPTTLS
jgi:hypothetical protein